MDSSHDAAWPMIPFSGDELAKEIYVDLNYNRFTYYPIHDRPRGVSPKDTV